MNRSLLAIATIDRQDEQQKAGRTRLETRPRQWWNYRKISKGAQIQRRKSVGLHNFGGTDIVKIRGTDIAKIGESAIAEGAKLPLPKARSPLRLGGLGSVVSSPSG